LQVHLFLRLLCLFFFALILHYPFLSLSSSISMYVPFYFNPSLPFVSLFSLVCFFVAFLCMFLFALSLHHSSLYLSSSLSIFLFFYVCSYLP
jgi:hypothetical protein